MNKNPFPAGSNVRITEGNLKGKRGVIVAENLKLSAGLLVEVEGRKSNPILYWQRELEAVEKPKSMIFETVVYDGRLKEFRILNLNSGSLYSNAFDNEGDALAEIPDGTERAGKIVRRVSLFEIREMLNERFNSDGKS